MRTGLIALGAVLPPLAAGPLIAAAVSSAVISSGRDVAGFYAPSTERIQAQASGDPCDYASRISSRAARAGSRAWRATSASEPRARRAAVCSSGSLATPTRAAISPACGHPSFGL